MPDLQASNGLTFEQISAEERASIAEAQRRSQVAPSDSDDCWGLAFSGGGIRSATFSLGVLQELCIARVFRHFDYLSTVSGGGFIGGWAIGQIRRRFNGNALEFEAQLASGRLKDSLTHLLRYRNYLLGPEADATAESWKRAVLYAGGLISNLLLLFVAITSLMLISRAVVDTIATITPDTNFGMAVGLVVPALVLACIALPMSSDNPEFEPPGGKVEWLVAFGALAFSVYATMKVAQGVAAESREWVTVSIVGAFGYFWLIGCLTALFGQRALSMHRVSVAMVVGLATVPALVEGGTVGLLARWLAASSVAEPYASGVLGLAGGTFAMAIALMFHLQMAGEGMPEMLRERLEGVAPRLVLIALLWFIVGSLATEGSRVIEQLIVLRALHLAGVAVALLLSLAVLVFLLVRGIGQILSLVIACALVAVVACVASYAGFRITLATDAWWSQTPVTTASVTSRPAVVIELAVAVGSAIGLGVLLKLFDVNQSALLRLYRSALARCFLAYRETVDGPMQSDVPLAAVADGGQRPFHIINATANAWSLVTDTVPFTFSTLHAGIAGDGRGGASYRRTVDVAHGRISMATALAISGAAVSPNARGFGGLRGVFLGIANARLGSWIGNPAHNTTWREEAPRFGGSYWFRELFGSKRSDAPYLYVTDGGQFENLGIYELVKRRCRVILAVDAGWDPLLAYEDLANAVRRCATDLSIHITIDSRALARDHRPDTPIRALAQIRYSEVDGPDARDGILVYLKPSVSDDVPIDVMSYAIQHPDFPYQSTADQFFNEAQFESYRRLGRHVAQTVLADPDVRKALAMRWHDAAGVDAYFGDESEASV